MYYAIYSPEIKRWIITDAHGNRMNNVGYKTRESCCKAKWFLYEREGAKILQRDYKERATLKQLEKHFNQI